ncbi:MAG: NDP-sugar synthase [Chloroflexi bacterium]|nr:NDP-sugar synthase [Chloroflexota bacterium]
MKAIILAAGMGTRLQALTNGSSKQLLPLGTATPIEYCIRMLSYFGFSEVLITAHHDAGHLIDYLSKKDFGLQLIFSVEDDLLNNASSLLYNRSYLNSDFLVLSGNHLAPTVEYKKIMTFHQKMKGISTVALKYIHDEKLLLNYDQAAIDEKGRITHSFFRTEGTKSHLIYAPFWIFTTGVFEYITKDKMSVQTLLNKLVVNHENVYGYVTSSDVLSINTPESYDDAKEKMDQLTKVFY